MSGFPDSNCRCSKTNWQSNSVQRQARASDHLHRLVPKLRHHLLRLVRQLQWQLLRRHPSLRLHLNRSISQSKQRHLRLDLPINLHLFQLLAPPTRTEHRAQNQFPLQSKLSHRMYLSSRQLRPRALLQRTLLNVSIRKERAELDQPRLLDLPHPALHLPRRSLSGHLHQNGNGTRLSTDLCTCPKLTLLDGMNGWSAPLSPKTISANLLDRFTNSNLSTWKLSSWVSDHVYPVSWDMD